MSAIQTIEDGIRIFTDHGAANTARIRIVDRKSWCDVPNVTGCDIRIRPDELVTATITTRPAEVNVVAHKVEQLIDSSGMVAERQVWETVRQLENDYVKTVIVYASVLQTLSMPDNREAVESGDKAAIARLWDYIDRAKANLEAEKEACG